MNVQNPLYYQNSIILRKRYMFILIYLIEIKDNSIQFNGRLRTNFKGWVWTKKHTH